MAEYIEREAAIKLFNFAVLDCLGMEPTIRAGDIIKALESIPAADVRPAPRWIPVTERLPGEGRKVIVAIRDESGDTAFDFTNTGWYSGVGDRFVVEDEYCSWVTHWMPLPQPPKEG